MKPPNYFIPMMVLSAGLIVGLSGVCNAEPKGGERFGDWRFQCKALPTNQNVCVLSQTLVNAETKKPILSLVLRRVGKDKKLVLMTIVPLGVFLAPGIAGKVDDGKRFKFVWQRCTTQGCQAAALVDDKLEKALKAGAHLLIAFQVQPKAKPITLVASLKGVTRGLGALGGN